MHFPPAWPPLPPLFTLNYSYKTTATSDKKVFWTKTSACRDGTLRNQANKIGTTPQHFQIIPTSCSILPSMHTTTSTLAYSNKRTSHSLQLSHKPSCIQDICHVQQQIQFHYTRYTLICHTDSSLLVHSTASVYKIEHVYHAQLQLL